MSHKPKLFRDPVHDTIAIAPHLPEGRLLLDLIDTPEVQRLRRIRQLGLTFLVYAGAEHSRFAHSMGVTWLAMAMVQRLEADVSVPPEERLVTLAASLLHDVGHGPFSHALEAVTHIAHERYSEGIITSPDTGVNAVLAARDPTLPARVADRVAQRGAGPGFLKDIVGSQLDADRLDYILRDGHATGVRIGAYDLARIMALLEVADDHLAVHTGAQEAVEGYLLARFHMYKQVYLHKTSRAAERMLEAALQRARTLHADGVDLGHWPSGPCGRLLEGEVLQPAAFATIDDMDIWVALKAWARGPDVTLAGLARGLTERRLWKTLPLPHDDPRRATELISAARSVARVKGHDPDYAVLVDESRDSLYKPFTGVTAEQRSIRMVDSAGNVSFIEDRSEVVNMLAHLALRQHLLCVHPDIRDSVARLVGAG